MSVTFDSEAKALIRLLDNFDDFNDELVDNIVDKMVGANGVIRQRFERKIKTQRTYVPLTEKTIKRKIKKNQKNVMVANGTLKGKTLATMTGKIKGNRLEFKAKVPSYGKIHNDGLGGAVKREFFGFKDRNGSYQYQDIRSFDRTQETEFDILLIKKGIKLRR